jgi:hypothetical protein
MRQHRVMFFEEISRHEEGIINPPTHRVQGTSAPLSFIGVTVVDLSPGGTHQLFA